MAGTKEGGLAAAATIKARHGETFYQRIGRLGGTNGHSGGFTSNPELARKAGAKGGRIGKRGAYSYRLNKVEPLADEIRKEYANSDSLMTIAKRHNLSYGVLQRWAKENLQTETWQEGKR